MKILFTFVLALIFTSCSKNKCDVTDDIYLKAKVVSTSDISCGIPLIYFLEDSTGIRNTTGKFELVYLAKDLSQSLNVLDKKIWVKVRKLKNEEEFVCNTLGPVFPAIKILESKPRD